MKARIRLHKLLSVLLCCIMLSLTACGSQSSGKIPGGTSDPKTETKLPENDPGGKGDLSGKDDPDGDTVTDEAARAALDLLRQCMADSPKAAAVAYLGYRDVAEQDGDLTDWLWTNAPGLMEKMAFLQSIPADRVLNGSYGDLYCVAPRDEHTSLAVNHVTWRSNGRGMWPVADEVLYRSEYAEPLLLFVRWEEFEDEPDVEIVIVPDGGVEVSWCPTRNLEDGGYIELPTGVDYEPLLLDFSRFGDVTGLDYPEDWEPAGDDWWLPPTDMGLADTTWVCDDWLMSLHYGDCDPDYAGIAELYHSFEDNTELTRVFSGVWRMEDDCLRLDLSAGVGSSLSGSFPILISPSGEEMHFQRSRSGEGVPFLPDDMDSIDLTRSYG